MIKKNKFTNIFINPAYYKVLFTLSLGIISSLIAFFIVWDLERTKITQKLEYYGNHLADSIAKKVTQNLQDLESIASFYAASEKVNRQEFYQFTKKKLAYNPQIHTIAWIPYIVNQDRQSYELDTQQGSLHKFQITEKNAQGKIIKAQSKNEYFPINFVEPKPKNKSLLGFDLGSDNNLLQVLQQSKEQEKAIATSQIDLFDNNNSINQKFLVFIPVYENNQETEATSKNSKKLEGFVLGVLSLESVVQQILQNYHYPQLELVIFNQSAPLESRLIYSSFLPSTSLPNYFQHNAQHHQFNFAQQELLLMIQPTREYILQQSTWYPWGVLAGGFMLTILSAIHIQASIETEQKLRAKETELEQRIVLQTQDLQLREAKYRQIFDHLAEGVFLCTIDGKYMHINPALATIFGYDSPQQLISSIENIGKQLFVNAEHWQELTTQVRQNQAVYGYECQAYRADGSKIWIVTNMHLFKNRKQQKIYYEGTIVDITARKQAEYDSWKNSKLLEGIRLAQSRFIQDIDPAILFDGLLENLLEITHSEYGFIGEVFHNKEGAVYVDEAYMKMRGKPYLKTHAITNIAWDEATRKFYAENAPQGMEFNNLKTLFGAVIITGEPVIANNPQTDPRRGGLPPGHPPLNAFLGLPFYSQNRLLGMVGVANRPDGYDQDLIDYLQPFLTTCSNIIEAFGNERNRRKIEIALSGSEERYRSIVNNANEGIWLFNTEGKTSFVNPRICQMLGYDSQDMSDRSFFEFLALDCPENQMIAIPLQESNNRESFDLLFNCQDGSCLWGMVSISPVFNPPHQYSGLLVMIMDISDRKQAEIELATAKQTVDIANRTKSFFLANMSHELRTPLNGILGSVRLLQANFRALSNNQLISHDSCASGLKTIENNGSYLLNLIDDILDFSQIDHAPIMLYATPIHLTTFLTEISAIVRAQAIAKGLTFTTEIPHNLPAGIEADRSRLKQILLELFNNALKFTHQGRISWRLIVIENANFLSTIDEINLKVKDFITLRFEVIDTGIGIEAEDLTKIFLPFEQLGEIHNRANGTGLGLTIAQQLLQLMNSNLKVTSCPGMGSSFWFDLDLPIIDNITVTEQHQEGSIVGYQGIRQRILVADDKLEHRLWLQNLLEPLGFEVHLAENGQQEIELAQELKPDLILTDLIMPIKTGFEAVRELRQINYFQQKPIIALSSSMTEIDAEQKQIAGCDELLIKPINKAQLLKALQKYLNLQWNYQATTVAQELPAKTLSNSNLILPPKDNLETVYELALLGSMKKIRQWANDLEQLDIQYQPFAEQLKKLSLNFQEKAIVNLLEQYLAN